MTKRQRLPFTFAAAFLAAGATVLLTSLLSQPPPARADPGILCVAPGGTGCSGPCGPCYASIQDAVTNAVAGDEIRVVAGVYTGSGEQVLYVDESVTIRGGYTTTNWTTPYPIAQPTTLDGAGQRRVVIIVGDITPTLEGLWLTNGIGADGGGIRALNAHPVISACWIYSNTASGQGGGGIYLGNSDNALLTDNAIYSNTATNGGGIRLHNSHSATLARNDVFSNTVIYSGGGVYISTSDDARLEYNHVFSNTAAQNAGAVGLAANHAAVLVHNRIHDNTASAGAGGGIELSESHTATLSYNDIFGNSARSGGGILLYESDGGALMDNRVFSNTATAGDGGGLCLSRSHVATLASNGIFSNTAYVSGGGVYLTESDDAMLRDNEIRGNATITVSGGGIHIWMSANATLMNNEIHNNTANWYGGGVRVYSSPTATLTSNQIYGNESGQHGGGVYLDSDNVSLVNNVVVDNRLTGSGSGAGVYLAGATARFVHTTLAHNSGGNGEGIYLWSGASWLINTILVSHTVGVEVRAGGMAELTHTLWGMGTWANEYDWINNGTLVTGTLAFNWWEEPGFVDPGNGDYHIGPASAAIDRGVDAGVATDIDGDPRLGAPDLGADEFVAYVHLPLVLRNHQ